MAHQLEQAWEQLVDESRYDEAAAVRAEYDILTQTDALWVRYRRNDDVRAEAIELLDQAEAVIETQIAADRHVSESLIALRDDLRLLVRSK
jgi:hypothetical protein